MKKIIALSILAIIIMLFGSEIRRGALAVLMLIDVVRPPEKAVMGRLIFGPSVKRVVIQSRGRMIKADLYVPMQKGGHTPLLLVHGVNPTGKDDPQLVVLAENLARAGFLVLVPDFEGMKRLRIRTSDPEDVVQCFLYISRLKQARPGGVMMGISYGAGPVLLASADKRVRDRVRLVVSFGGYGDLRAVLMYALTGYYDYAGQHGYTRPDDSFRWMFLYKNLDLIGSAHDRDVLKAIIERRNRYEFVEADALVKRLGPEGRAIYAFLSNREHGRFVMLYENLPISLREYMEMLSPARVLKQSKASFIIAHGTEDYSIPYTESLRIADAVGDKGRVQIALLPQFMHIEHMEPEPAKIFGRYVVGGWRLFSLIYSLLGWR